ncbi:MAG: phosphoenolpyruvate--protein phosphotransferase [Solirubrobacteraceae bacterium]
MRTASATEALMVGIVVVSHSARLAEGVVELAREMGGEEVAIAPAGGMDDGSIGTDPARVMAAIESARGGGDGVLVLMDLGSAVMSAEMAVEMLDGEDRVALVGAPLVEGAVAAAAVARTGADLDAVAAEARGALGAKAAHLGEEAPAAAAAPAVEEDADALKERLPVRIRLGLHARPVARIVALAGAHDARITVANATTGAGPAHATSLTALATLAARQGHELAVTASGPDAEAALAALRELADEGFGDGLDGAAPAAAAPEPEAPAPGTAPEAGAELHGIAASAGIAIGPARLLARAEVPVAEEPAGDPESELAALDAAIAATSADLAETRARTAERAGAGEAAIFDAHAMLLGDDSILDPARESVRGGRAAGAAYRDAAERAAEQLAGLDDALLRERAVDVRDVAARVLAHLAGTAPVAHDAAGVLVADDLTPGQTAALDREQVLGIATARGSTTAHAAILARALGIPAVLGLGADVLEIADGTPVVLDGGAGTVVVDPGDDAIARERRRGEELAEQRARAQARAQEDAVTRDGARIEVAANIGSPAEVARAVEQGAEGVGLLRTEFLFLGRDELPGEDEQAATYAQIARDLGGRPLIVRTADIGADKPLPAVPQAPEDNPFLGQRGLRLALARPELLRTQLRAIARAASEGGHGTIRVMFPMVSTLAELRAARAVLDEVRGDVRLEVGIMVEVPAAALRADQLAPEVDFFSIGTNDLAQYTMAAERGNPALASLLDGPHPALLRLIAGVAEAAEANGIWTGVCGELAGDPPSAVLLAGLGVSELSMAAGLIPAAKEALRAIDLPVARDAARAALSDEDAAAARARGRALLDGS